VEFFASGYLEAKNEGAKCDFDVFFGWEFGINGSEFLTYGLDVDFLLKHPDLDKYGLKDYSEAVRSHGGYLAQAHPYRQMWWVASPFPVEPGLIDGIEVFNGCMEVKLNKKALQYARQFNIPMQAGSDTHIAGNDHVPFTSGISLYKRAKDINDIIMAIKSKQVELVVPDGFMKD
jgi:hypothetical protein